MHDNTLAAALMKEGCDIQLVPLYTPIRTDEEDVSIDRVFFGGINMFLQERVPFFRALPAFADRWLNSPKLIKRVAGGSMSIEASELGELTLSMLRGDDGNQRKEVRRLVKYTVEEARPDVINLTNLLVAGFVPALRRVYDVPVLVTLQGDDLYLDELEDPYRSKVIVKMQNLAQKIDGFVVNAQFYAEKMSELLKVPIERFQVVPLGLNLKDFSEKTEQSAGAAPTIGYLARISPEKGFGVLVDAFLKLRQLPGMERVRLAAAGWLGDADRDFLEEQKAKIREMGLEADFEYKGVLDRTEKIKFLQSLDVFSVPTMYEEPKGLFVLEALACGVPVVQPAHGAFPEMLERSGGGRLFPVNDPLALAKEFADLLRDHAARKELGADGRTKILEVGGAEEMARSMLAVYEKVLKEKPVPSVSVSA